MSGEMEMRCRNCERPIVRPAPGWASRDDRQWVHRPIEPESYAYYFCTIVPGRLLSSNRHAEPSIGLVSP